MPRPVVLEIVRLPRRPFPSLWRLGLLGLLEFLGALGVLGGATGCAPPGSAGPDEVARARAAIINGEPSDAEDDSAVVLPLFQRGQFVGSCSGVLVAANLVLTARHCVSDVDTQSACDSEGNAIAGAQVHSDRAAKDLGVLTGSTLRLTVDANGAELFTLPDTTVCNRDIALIRLDKAILDVPIAQLRLKSPPVEGETIRAVGWGISNNSSGQPSRRRRGGIEILSVGPLDSSAFGGIGGHEFMVGESICQGDSGGPAYAETTRAVLGVVSRGGNGKNVDPNVSPGASCIDDGQFVTRNLYTRVDGFPDLLAAAFAAAGAEPWEEGGADPRKAKLAEVCRANADCRSDLCLGLPEAGYCSSSCDTAAACPASLACEQTSAGTRFCVRPHEGGCSMSAAPASLGGVAVLMLALAAALRLRSRRRRA